MIKYAVPFVASAVTATFGTAGDVIHTPRFALTVPPNALRSTTTFSLTEQNDRGMEITIEPTGLAFVVPATLTFSYAGTSGDPASPNFVADGALTAAWFDASASHWTAIGGTNDPAAKQLTVSLDHLSYYALAK